jgi:hypothetical protein
MIGDAIAGLGALKTAFDLARALKGIDDTVKRNAAVIELQEQILSATQAQSDLVRRVEHLEKEVARFETWETEKKRYQLKDFGSGTLAYELKQSEAADEPIHCICPGCYENRRRGILQPTGSTNAFKQKEFVCVLCNTEYRLGVYVKFEVGPAPRGEYF